MRLTPPIFFHRLPLFLGHRTAVSRKMNAHRIRRPPLSLRGRDTDTRSRAVFAPHTAELVKDRAPVSVPQPRLSGTISHTAPPVWAPSIATLQIRPTVFSGGDGKSRRSALIFWAGRRTERPHHVGSSGNRPRCARLSPILELFERVVFLAQPVARLFELDGTVDPAFDPGAQLPTPCRRRLVPCEEGRVVGHLCFLAQSQSS